MVITVIVEAVRSVIWVEVGAIGQLLLVWTSDGSWMTGSDEELISCCAVIDYVDGDDTVVVGEVSCLTTVLVL